MISLSNLAIDFFLHTEGLSPYGYHTTMRALDCIGKLFRFKKIADIGSGIGTQTKTLCEITKSQIIAVDFIPQFVDYLRRESVKNELQARIYPVLASPDNLPFEDRELDMIWAESVADRVGFDYVLNNWSRYLKMDGYIAICSYCWLSDNPPEIVAEYWKNSNREIASIHERILQIEKAGFVPIAHFVMPDECWWNYFCPLEENFNRFLVRYSDNSEAEELVEAIDREIDLFEKYGEYYGYVFFIGKKEKI